MSFRTYLFSGSAIAASAAAIYFAYHSVDTTGPTSAKIEVSRSRQLPEKQPHFSPTRDSVREHSAHRGPETQSGGNAAPTSLEPSSKAFRSSLSHDRTVNPPHRFPTRGRRSRNLIDDETGHSSQETEWSASAIQPSPTSPDVLHFENLRIEVHGYDTPENGGDLLISVTPEPNTSSPRTSITNRGFTLEEELFRAKWGWVAYDQVKRVASESIEAAIR